MANRPTHPPHDGVPPDAARATLDRVLAEKGVDYSAASRLIGRNPAYIQQYIKRGSPRRLAERDRATLAGLLDIDEARIGGPPRLADAATAAAATMVPVPRLDVGASAGPGAHADGERAIAHMAFDRQWLRAMGLGSDGLSLIRVAGDSMAPTLVDGDDILVEALRPGAMLRDGIHVLRRDGALLVKRIVRDTAGPPGRVSVVSDNAAYPSDRAVRLDRLDLVGRVVWAGRRLV